MTYPKRIRKPINKFVSYINFKNKNFDSADLQILAYKKYNLLAKKVSNNRIVFLSNENSFCNLEKKNLKSKNKNKNNKFTENQINMINALKQNNNEQWLKLANENIKEWKILNNFDIT